jgi:hypothetical protein
MKQRGGETMLSAGHHGVPRRLFVSSIVVLLTLALAGPASAGKPGYEPAYVNGTTVTINAIEVPQRAPLRAQADFYQVVYPIIVPGHEPQCDPCDHQGNGVDFTDFHDHVLDSIPGWPGHGEFSPLWHVFLVLPAVTGGPGDAAIVAAYMSHLPTTSEAAVDALLADTLNGQPIALEIDTHFYFLCSVVGSTASH